MFQQLVRRITCVFVCVCVPNPLFQNDSPLSGIKKGGGWLVVLVGGWPLLPLNNREGLNLHWSFSSGSPHVKTLLNIDRCGRNSIGIYSGLYSEPYVGTIRGGIINKQFIKFCWRFAEIETATGDFILGAVWIVYSNNKKKKKERIYLNLWETRGPQLRVSGKSLSVWRNKC